MCMGRKAIKKDLMLDGKLVSVEVRDFNQAGAAKSLELLGKHLKLFTDKTEVTGKDGGPIETKTITADMDPKEASRLYKEWMARHD